MEILNRQASLEAFFLLLRRARQSVLMLDYDGTLAPFQQERDKALPYSGVKERLELLAGSVNTRLIIISGRQVADLKKLLALERWPELWGCHGAERVLPDGSTQFVELSEGASESLEAAQVWAENQHLEKSLELKPASVAFHWRGMPNDQAQEIEKKVRQRWQENDAGHELELHEFDGGLELRLPGIDKGHAVATILGEANDHAVCAYLGDDRTDEDAFEQLAGLGLSVLVRPNFRPTIADIWLQPPQELLNFLDHWLQAVGISLP